MSIEHPDKEQLLEALTESFSAVTHTVNLGREFGGTRELPIPAQSLAHQAVRIFEQFSQEPWRPFNKDDEGTWPQEDGDYWIMVDELEEPIVQGWDPANCGPELGWDSYRAEYVRCWQPIPVPAPPSMDSDS